MTWTLGNIQELGSKGVSPHLENDGDNSRETYQLHYTANGGVTVDGMSNDLELTKQGQINFIQDLTIVTTNEGNRRAYYVEVEPNSGKHEIYTALISEDGLSLSEASSTGISNSDDEAWGVPDSVILPDGRVRIYWVKSDTQAKTLANEVIISATSTTEKGTNFSVDAGNRVEGGYVDFEVLRAEDNDWIAIMSSSPVTIPDQPQGIYIGTSQDGISWKIKENNLAPTSKSYLDPTGIQLPGSDNKWQIVMSSSLSILGDREYSLVASELTFTSTSTSTSTSSSELENVLATIENSTNIADLGLATDSNYKLSEIKDFGGTLHAGASSDAEGQYKYKGEVDLNGDGVKEKVFTNKISGRWASLEVDPTTGKTNYSDHGEGGGTRVVGIYNDPLVLSGEIEKGSDHDSQTRFQNDLWADNLSLGVGGDFDSDGTDEVYWRTNDGTAYLRSLHHGDGNIQYANYQSFTQMSDYLTSTGNSDLISTVVG